MKKAPSGAFFASDDSCESLLGRSPRRARVDQFLVQLSYQVIFHVQERLVVQILDVIQRIAGVIQLPEHYLRLEQV